MAQVRSQARSSRARPAPAGWQALAAALPRFTPGGYFALVLLLLLGAAAAATRNNLVFLLGSLLGALFLFSFWYPLVSLRRLALHREAPGELFAGEEVLFRVRLRNRGAVFSAYAVAVRDLPEVSSLARFGFAFVFHVPPGGEGASAYRIKFRRRGLYRGSGYRLSSSFPFGLFERRIRGSTEAEFLVYPRIRPVRFETRGSFLPGVNQLSENTFGGRDEFKRLREYQPGDHPKFIHWKASARHRKLMVRDNERYEKRKVTLVLDLEPLRRARAARAEAVFERAVSLTASLALALVREGSLVRLVLGGRPDRCTAFDRSPDHLRSMLRDLATVEAAPGRSLRRTLAGLPGLEGSTLLVVAQGARRLLRQVSRAEAGGEVWFLDAAARQPVCRRLGASARGAAPEKHFERLRPGRLCAEGVQGL